MADEERVLVIKFVGDVSDPERSLDRLEDRASRGIRVAGGRGGFAEPGVFSSAPRGYGAGASSEALSERFELRYQNRLAADLARTERARERESRAAERAAAAEEKRAQAAERAAERVAQRTSSRVERNFEATEFAQFRQGVREQERAARDQSRQVQGYRDLFYRTRRQLADDGEGGGGRNVGDYLFRRVVLGAALYGGGRLIEGVQQYGEAQALAGNDPLAQFKATEQFRKTVASSVPFLGAVADFLADPFGRQSTGTALQIQGAEAGDALSSVRAANAEARIRLSDAAAAASQPTQYGRQRESIEANFRDTARRIHERERSEQAAAQKTEDNRRAVIEQQFQEDTQPFSAGTGAGPDAGAAARYAAAEARRRTGIQTLNREIGSMHSRIGLTFGGEFQSAEDIQKGQLREIDAGPARQLEALRGQTQALNLQAQNRPFEATLAAQRSAGTVQMMGAQTPEIANAIAIKNVQELFETIAKFMREVGSINRGNFGAAAVNRLIIAGDERAAGIERINQAKADELGKLPAGVVGDALRPGIEAKYRTEQDVFTKQFDIQRSLENQSMMDRETVARQMALGHERSARGIEIRERAEEEASGFQQRGGPDAQRRARLALQTGLYEEQSYLRQLKMQTEGYGASGQNIGLGGIGAGFGQHGARGGGQGPEPLINAIEKVQEEIKQLRMELKGIE